MVEDTNISGSGFWVFLGDRELFVSFKHFPESGTLPTVASCVWLRPDLRNLSFLAMSPIARRKLKIKRFLE